MFIYLAHPLDQAKSVDPSTLARVTCDLVDAIRDQGHTAYRPKFVQPTPPWTEHDMDHIDAINRFALLEADALLAVLLPEVPTLGTVVEVEQALSVGTPVCIVTTEKLRQQSIQLANWAGRGAEVVFCSPEGRIHGLDLARVLAAEPPREQIDVTGLDGRPAFLDGKVATAPILEVMLTDPAAKPPARAHDSDAGYDLTVIEETVIKYGVRTLLRTGVSAPPPPGWWGLIKARSSTQAAGVQVNEAVIDAGYHGELFVSVTLVNPAHSNVTIEAGSRLAQYILMPTFPGTIRQVTELSPSQRGGKGWGSSGR